MNQNSKSIMGIAELIDPLAYKIANRERPLDEATIFKCLERGLYGTKHRAITNPNEMDAMSIFRDLVRRQAVVSIDDYVRKRSKAEHLGQRSLGDGVRRGGPIVGLKANPDTFALSVTIKDHTILEGGETGEKVGAERTFTVIDDYGKVRPLRIKVLSVGREMYFIGEGIQELSFDTAVHRNRWQSFLSSVQILLLLLLWRMDDEMERFGAPKEPVVSSESMDTIIVPTLKSEIKPGGFFFRVDPVRPAMDMDQFEQLRQLVLAHVRSNDLAYYLHGYDAERIPKWIDPDHIISSWGSRCKMLWLGSRDISMSWEELKNEVQVRRT
ncbi:hypothetical protein ACFL2R_02820 [Patescibacteria group bacterium]